MRNREKSMYFVSSTSEVNQNGITVVQREILRGPQKVLSFVPVNLCAAYFRIVVPRPFRLRTKRNRFVRRALMGERPTLIL